MVNRFLDHSLSVKELDEFVHHIEECPSCRDELETGFFIRKVMDELDDKVGSGESLDILDLLEEDLRHARHVIYIDRMEKILIRAAQAAGATMLAALLAYLLANRFL
ncbi:MAG: zf-HC2 domain-containing protein [Oscillospiraceae bacterium]|nr:zf-HC2 domain-containing protein [Blautia sp.]MBR2999513.1 zf-HC2 domain-containing protein [Oscillospiraceae bacterium]